MVKLMKDASMHTCYVSMHTDYESMHAVYVSMHTDYESMHKSMNRCILINLRQTGSGTHYGSTQKIMHRCMLFAKVKNKHLTLQLTLYQGQTKSNQAFSHFP